MDKFINDAIVGNQIVTASFSKKGELLRLFYPHIDYKQFVDKFHTGVKINDSALIYLHEDINNVYNQNYIENTNILQTEILNTYFNLKVLQTDYVPINKNFLVKKYMFKNESDKSLNVDFLVYSKILTNINNDTCGYCKNNTLIQYNHDYSVCLFSRDEFLSYQINGASNNFMSGIIGGKDYIGLSSDSSVSYKIGEIKPGESITKNIFILINDNKEKNVLDELDNEIEKIKNIDELELFESTKTYWNDFVEKHDKLNIENSKISDKIKNIYTRSILLFPLLQNNVTGGISAGMEIDEYKQKSGRYSYCWTRDAVFITKGLDIIGMTDETTKFYEIFCKKTQSKSGMWEQRFYTDGRLAPGWGYQIDETASVIIGIYDHYLRINNNEFLKNNFEMCEKAIDFLQEYIIDVLEGKNKFQKSYDLWEMYEGISLYSMAVIYSAFDKMIKIDEILKPIFETSKIESIERRDKNLNELKEKIKNYSLNNFYNNERECFVRNIDDKKIDISVLGAITPCQMFNSKDDNILNTIQKIDMTLKTYTGGYIRFEGDTYMGGQNPWPIANLWIALYYLELGDKEKAIQNFNFVVQTATAHGFLGEQVDNEKMEANWVIGLAWSHAMFLIVLEKLKGEIF